MTVYRLHRDRQQQNEFHCGNPIKDFNAAVAAELGAFETMENRADLHKWLKRFKGWQISKLIGTLSFSPAPHSAFKQGTFSSCPHCSLSSPIFKGKAKLSLSDNEKRVARNQCQADFVFLFHDVEE